MLLPISEELGYSGYSSRGSSKKTLSEAKEKKKKQAASEKAK